MHIGWFGGHDGSGLGGVAQPEAADQGRAVPDDDGAQAIPVVGHPGRRVS
jgi:hypothetical protein